MTADDHGLYARSFADVYDQWYSDLDEPGWLVESFGRRCPPGGQIYEFGAGTGRLAVPLSQAGFTVIGLDVSHKMLTDMSSGPRGVAADMTAVGLRSSSADAVLVAYNTLFNLASGDLQRACFDEAARLLRPGGLLVLEAFIAPSSATGLFGLTIRAHPTEADAKLAIITGPDVANEHAIVGAHIELGATTTCRPWRLVYQSPEQLDSLAAAAGLELLERSHDWQGTELPADAARHVSWYRRPTAG